jgi:hypothetical protein
LGAFVEDNVGRLVIVLGLLVVLVVGGALTIQLVSSDGDVASLLPYLQQTDSPEASPLHAEPWQAEQFFLLVGFLLFNLIGIGATIALIMWVLDRQVKIARATASASAEAEGEKPQAQTGRRAQASE